MQILITGAAGFIGYHLSRRLLEEGHTIIGIDNLNDYYSPRLKQDRIQELEKLNLDFCFYKLDLTNKMALNNLFKNHSIDTIYHLAAQAGVRYSLTNPDEYIQSNIIGFYHLLEASRHFEIKHLIFASSSSVYGANQKVPYKVSDHTDHPISLYAATKKSSEMLAYSYSHLYGIPMTGLRFFTVYGPWGRPDMAYFKFTDRIISGKEIEIYNNGDMYRDFTYVNDIVEALFRLMNHIPAPSDKWDPVNPDPSCGPGPYRLYNIGKNNPVKLMEFIAVLEKELNLEAKKVFKPMQPGDVYTTWADCNSLYDEINYSPDTPLEKGIQAFVEWYNNYYSS